jgi:hypothetical protein
LTFVRSGFGPAATAQQPAGQSRADNERSRQAIFRYDTFGDEQLWTDVRETPRRLADDSLRNSLHNLVG